jgi:hypothetical protein
LKSPRKTEWLIVALSPICCPWLVLLLWWFVIVIIIVLPWKEIRRRHHHHHHCGRPLMDGNSSSFPQQAADCCF